MIDRGHDLPISKQAEALKISRGTAITIAILQTGRQED
jgi:hypothetical protein